MLMLYMLSMIDAAGKDLGHGHPAAGHRDRRALHARRGPGDDRGRRRGRRRRDRPGGVHEDDEADRLWLWVLVVTGKPIPTYIPIGEKYISPTLHMTGVLGFI
jgi:hypothetical protein